MQNAIENILPNVKWPVPAWNKWSRGRKSAKIWVADKKGLKFGQNLEEKVEMHSLIRFIPSASLLGGGRDIYKKEYYYACVQKWDLGTLTVHVYMLNQLLYSLKHMAVAPNSVSQRCASTEGYFRFSSVDFGWYFYTWCHQRILPIASK